MPKPTDRCPPLTNLYYGAPGHEKVECYCCRQPGLLRGTVRGLVTVWREGKGNPTRAEICPRLAGKGKP